MDVDALNRRTRFAKPQPASGALVLTERDVAIFQAIDRHGKLPTNYLFELTRHIGSDYSMLQRRLTRLYNGCTELHAVDQDTPARCAQGFLSRDPAQHLSASARYQPLVYGLTPVSRQILDERGLSSRRRTRGDPFVHQLFGACFSASVKLRSGSHRFIPLDEILARASCPRETQVASQPLRIATGQPDVPHVEPDDLFGLQYAGGGYRFFAVEIDRNTESIRSSRGAKSTIARKISAYEAVLRMRCYATRFGIPNLTVLFATTNAEHLARVKDFARKQLAAEYQRKLLLKAFTDFGAAWRVPRETLPVFGPWDGLHGSVDICVVP
jgi:hypothetical protein